MKESRTFYESLGKRVLETVKPADVPQERKNRINYCQAWYNEVYVDGRPIIAIRSYNTIVAFLDIYTDCLVSLGRYSITTYQHVRKYRNNYCPNMWNTSEINVELVNWF